MRKDSLGLGICLILRGSTVLVHAYVAAARFLFFEGVLPWHLIGTAGTYLPSSNLHPHPTTAPFWPGRKVRRGDCHRDNWMTRSHTVKFEPPTPVLRNLTRLHFLPYITVKCVRTSQLLDSCWSFWKFFNLVEII